MPGGGDPPDNFLDQDMTTRSDMDDNEPPRNRRRIAYEQPTTNESSSTSTPRRSMRLSGKDRASARSSTDSSNDSSQSTSEVEISNHNADGDILVPTTAAPEEKLAEFPLMRLPTELRLHVYRCALVRAHPVTLHREPKILVPPSPTTQPDASMLFDFRSGQNTPESTGITLGLPRTYYVNGRPRTISRRSARVERIYQARQNAAVTDGHTWLERQRAMASSVLPRQQQTATASLSSSSVQPQPDPDAAPTRDRSQERAPLKRKRARNEPDNDDDLSPALLCISQTVYKEARQVLYSENTFALEFGSAISTLGSLHQRSRSMIKRIRLVVPSPSDILDDFAEIVRLGLRYCWGLERLTIILPFRLTSDDGDRRFGLANTTTMHMYANAFNILRWLPRSTEVVVEGEVCEEVRKTIMQNATLAKSLDEKAYARRQHQIRETRDRETAQAA